VAQGYFTARPMPGDEIPLWLTGRALAPAPTLKIPPLTSA
jgi:hypothetical protein